MIRIKPILFNTDMVQAIMDGRKTVTRRICKEGNDYTVPDMGFYDADRRTYAVHSYADKEHTDRLSLAERPCPVCPGDILYVSETWSQTTDLFGESPEYIYRADSGMLGGTIWHPSIHMPKEAARIWLKVKDVKVERLCNMKLDDFLSEGVCIRPEAFNDPENAYMQARDEFITIWNSTVPRGQQNLYGWAASPWVWVIGFERCSKPEEQEFRKGLSI